MSNAPDFSFEEQGAAPAAPGSLDSLNQKLEEAVSLKEAVDQLEADLKAAKQALNSLTTGAIPDLMAQMGIDEITQRGWQIKVSEFVSGSLPKDPDQRKAAIDWLESNEGGDLLKTSLGIDFSRSQHNEAIDLFEELRTKGFVASLDSTVHPQTLLVFARERMKNGDPLDPEVLGLYTGRVAKFKRIGG